MEVFGQFYLDRGIPILRDSLPEATIILHGRLNQVKSLYDVGQGFLFNMIGYLGKHVDSFTEYALLLIWLIRTKSLNHISSDNNLIIAK